MTSYTGHNRGTENIVTSIAPPLKRKGCIINFVHNAHAHLHVHVHTEVLHIATLSYTILVV